MTQTSNTETHIGVDEKLKQGYSQNAMEEGFGAASGVRPETSSSGGKITHSESKDAARRTGKISNHLDEQNEGLAGD